MEQPNQVQGQQQPMGGQAMGGAGNEQFMGKFKEATNHMKEMLYGKGFDQMIQLFQESGQQSFGDAMAMIIPATLEQIEEQHGELEPQVLIMTLVTGVAMVASDVIEAGVVEGIEPEDVQLAISASLATWTEANEGRVNLDEMMAKMQGEVNKQKQAGGNEEVGMLAQQAQATGMGGM